MVTEGSLLCLHDASSLARALSADPALHVYLLGDLDPFFWPRTTWYGWSVEGSLEAILLVYAFPGTPAVVLMCSEQNRSQARALLEASIPLLPRSFVAHLTLGLADLLEAAGWRVARRERALRMSLTSPSALHNVGAGVSALTDRDLPALEALFERSYPDNWFDPSMVATGYYRGVRRGGEELLSVAGVHVVCPDHGVAALGNITTAPEHRRRGLGSRTIARLCEDLLQEVDVIALNVEGDNSAARLCYEGLGFVPWADFELVTFTS